MQNKSLRYIFPKKATILQETYIQPNIMSITIELKNQEHVSHFIHLFREMRGVTTDINVLFTPEYIHIQTMDFAKVMLINVKLCADWFDEYNVEQDITLGMNLKIMHAILNCHIPNGSITLEYSDGDDTMGMTFTDHGENPIIREKHFALPLVDMDCEELDIPDMEYQVDLTLTTSLFHDVIKELQTFSDTIQFHLSEDKVAISTPGNADDGNEMSCKASVVIDPEHIDEFSIEEDLLLECGYSSKYLATIAAFHKLAHTVDVNVSENAPISFKYGLSQDSSVALYLAPKMDD